MTLKREIMGPMKIDEEEDWEEDDTGEEEDWEEEEEE